MLGSGSFAPFHASSSSSSGNRGYCPPPRPPSGNAPASDADVYSYKTKDVVIDSSDRNTGLFPDPQAYEIQLDEEIQDVTSLELVGADVPFPEYLVNQRNKVFQCRLNGGASEAVVLAAGDYDAVNLAAEVQGALNAISPNAFSVRYIARTDAYQIACRSPFSLKFPQGVASPARLLGHPAGVEIAAQFDASVDPIFTHHVTSKYRRDFQADRYLVLHIEPAYAKYNPQNTAINKSFAIVPVNIDSMNVRSKNAHIKRFNPPVMKFSKIKVRFVTRDNQPYNFHGRDHRLELRFTSIRQKKYALEMTIAPFEGIVSEK